MDRYVLILRDSYDSESISCVLDGGESLIEAQAKRRELEKQANRHRWVSVERVRDELPEWERPC